MDVEIERLLALIQFAQQSAALKANPISDVTNHNIFHEHESALQSLPGIHFNPGGEEQEIWLRVDRLHETQPPLPKNALLKVWIDLANTPYKPPELKASVELAKLVEAGLRSVPTEDKEYDPKKIIYLTEVEEKSELPQLLKAYVQSQWDGWCQDEKRRRHTIKLYSHLFTLKQQLEGAIVDAQIEIAWGVGIGVWKINERRVCYPLITRLVDIIVDELSMAINVSPRDVDPHLEMDIYTSAANPGVAELEEYWKKFCSESTQTFSPFDTLSYEPVLRHAVAGLDSKGVYWPSQVKPDDRTLPSASDELKVTDTWVIFARPRSKNLFIQDLERFKKKIESDASRPEVPRAVRAIVTEPSKEHHQYDYPSFRGVSGGGDGPTNGATDLYFPKPFNEEQVRIVQLLEAHDGVVVQGPPGTGKTHTIANIICHYFALGKRVLVTSMKEPALSVLREKLPEEVRSLAISLLASEQDGMKQFEHAIYQISSEIQRIDQIALQKDIADLEGNRINALHAALSLTDRKIEEWAKKSLSRIHIDGETLEPVNAATEVVKGKGQFEWINEQITAAPEFIPQFNESDIHAIREARDAVRDNLDYLKIELPEIVSLPSSDEVVRLHHDLSQYALLSAAIKKGELIPLVDYSVATMEKAAATAQEIRQLLNYMSQLDHDHLQWTKKTYSELLRNDKQILDGISIFEKVIEDLDKVMTGRRPFIERPVSIPNSLETSDIHHLAIQNLIEGRQPFGIIGLVSKSEEKKKLQEIKIMGATPKTTDDWRHVQSYLILVKSSREIVTRWNVACREISVPAFDNDEPEHIARAAQIAPFLELVRKRIELEHRVAKLALSLFSTWQHHSSLIGNRERIEEALLALESHGLRHKLTSALSAREKLQALFSRYNGRIIEKFVALLADDLGNPDIQGGTLQSKWLNLLEELRYLLGLKSHFLDISNVSDRIESSGGKNWAAKLRTHSKTGTVDDLLPDNWFISWRLKRLSNTLDAADGRNEMKQLFERRRSLEADLAKTYSDVVVKRTWLKLAQNATPDIRAALEAFRSAISKIGKGTGKRAVRYRQDARNAAVRANRVIPCWIMPHWRVSEALPPEFGCFDLVIIDEASQSDLSALPSLLRAKKVLIVGDDKQVSPDGVGLEEDKIRSLMARYLANQVETFRAQMTPERSIYDLFKVVFASSGTMLKEHFRCVGPIIEYSKREFYNHELRPVRLAKPSERLDPPLVDVLIEDGFKKEDKNIPEARYIVDEIKRICADPKMESRTIGVVSLLGDTQAYHIWEMLEEELGPEEIKKHQIACGDARTFQGKERNIMFLSMVSSPGDVHAQTRDATAQRYNVAASRAQDRMYLVRSVGLDHLSPKDTLRRNLITHFVSPYGQDEVRVENLRQLCESDFEREVYDLLIERGFKITPQVKVGAYRIDMVVEGQNDRRLAIECDGDRFHGPEKWADDMNRQRVMERVGWQFWRCFASVFIKNREDVVNDLMATLRERGIEPIGATGAGPSIHTEHRRITVFTASNDVELPLLANIH